MLLFCGTCYSIFKSVVEESCTQGDDSAHEQVTHAEVGIKIKNLTKIYSQVGLLKRANCLFF